MDKAIFSVQALMTIMSDCYKYKVNYEADDGLETGGVFVGPKDRNAIITDVIPSSAHAERRSATYYQSDDDVEFLNRQLKGFQKKGYDFKGYYHQHPSGMSRLSDGDLETCADILKSPDCKINNNLLMVIVTETSDPQQFPLFLYRVFLNKCKRPVVKSLPYRVLPKGCIHELAIDCQ